MEFSGFSLLCLKHSRGKHALVIITVLLLAVHKYVIVKRERLKTIVTGLNGCSFDLSH